MLVVLAVAGWDYWQNGVCAAAGVHTSAAFPGRRNGGRFSPLFFHRSGPLRRVSDDIIRQRPVPAGLPVT